MATLAERRAELDAAMVAAGVAMPDTWGRQEPPYALAFLGSSDFSPGPGRQVRLGFRITGIVSKATDAISLAAADDLAVSMIGAVRDLAGWRLDGLSPLGTRDLAGSTVYAIDLNVSVLVDI